MLDPYNLRRFAEAQAPVFDDVRRELGEGRKTTHWMWFVFPQLTGLGRTATARHFGISSVAEARAYLRDPVLGTRLREATTLLRDYSGSRTIVGILGSIDALKLRSSMTLFASAAGDPDDRVLFEAVLDRYYDGLPDELTLAMLSGD